MLTIHLKLLIRVEQLAKSYINIIRASEASNV